MAYINEMLSPQLRVPDLKPGEMVKFRLLKKGEIDPQTGFPYTLADYWMQGKEMIFDPYNKKNKNVLILNAVGFAPVTMPDHTTKYDPRVEYIKWDSTGEKLLGEDAFETICFLRRSNKNKSNPFRNKRRKALFEEINERVILATKFNDENLDLDARLYVRDCDWDELKGIAMNLKMNVDNDKLDALRINLMEMVRKDPRGVMLASSNKKMKVKIQVMDAERYEILIFDHTTRSWFYKEKLTDKPLCQVDLDKDKLEGILDFFKTPAGQAEYARFSKTIKTLYEAKIA